MSTTAILFDLDNTLVPEMVSYESAFDTATESTVRRLELEPAALRDAVFGAAAKLWLASPVSAYCLRVGIGSPTSLVSDFPGTGDELAYLREWASAYRRESWVSGLEQLGVQDSVTWRPSWIARSARISQITWCRTRTRCQRSSVSDRRTSS